MRTPWLALAMLILPLAACDRGSDRTQQGDAARPTLSIQKSDMTPKPAPSRGKLAVLPDGVAADRAAPAPVAAPEPAAVDRPAAPEPPPERVAAMEQNRWGGDPSFDDRGRGPDLQPPTLRDCRRAERRGEPLADSPFCADMLGPARMQDDCLAARDQGDDFGWSRQCRAALGD